jgi:hypothetical protein
MGTFLKVGQENRLDEWLVRPFAKRWGGQLTSVLEMVGEGGFRVSDASGVPKM